MKHSIHVNQKQALDLGMTNINQAHIFDLLTGVSTWAKPEVINEEVYYWVSRQRICTELPLLDMKPDTVYRHLKKLSDCGLIEYLKHGKKDCIRLTEKGRSYYVGYKSEYEKYAMSDSNPDDYVGNESELPPNSEMNPKKLGNESEKNSDLNPTDQTTNNILQPVDQKKNKQKKEAFDLPDWIDQDAWDEWISHRKKLKASNSPRALRSLIKDLETIKRSGYDPTEAIDIALKKGWKTVQLEYLQNMAGSSKPANDFENKNYSDGAEGFITHG